MKGHSWIQSWQLFTILLSIHRISLWNGDQGGREVAYFNNPAQMDLFKSRFKYPKSWSYQIVRYGADCNLLNLQFILSSWVQKPIRTDCYKGSIMMNSGPINQSWAQILLYSMSVRVCMHFIVHIYQGFIHMTLMSFMLASICCKTPKDNKRYIKKYVTLFCKSYRCVHETARNKQYNSNIPINL